MSQVIQAAEINAFITGAARRAYTALVPQFEQATGHKLITQFDLPPTLIRKVEAGEPYDVIMLSYDVEALIKRGWSCPIREPRSAASASASPSQRGAKAGLHTVEAFKSRCSTPSSSPRRVKAAAGVTSPRCSSGWVSPIRSSRRSGRDPAAPRHNWCRGRGRFRGVGAAALIGTPKSSGSAISRRNPELAAVQRRGSVNAKEPAAGRALLDFLTTPGRDGGVEGQRLGAAVRDLRHFGHVFR